MQASDKEISTISVNRVGKPVQLNLGMPSEKFLEEFMKIPPRFRSPYLLDSQGNIYAASFAERKDELGYGIGSHKLSYLSGQAIFMEG